MHKKESVKKTNIKTSHATRGKGPTGPEANARPRALVVNKTIVNSIPLNKDLKRYFIKWFEGMCQSNGNQFAVAKVKALRELVMAYRSDPNRLNKREEYLTRAPIRKNKRLRQLFDYADANPHATLAFLKLYLGEGSTLVTPEGSSDEMHNLLESIKYEPQIPSELAVWCAVLRMSPKDRRSVWFEARKDPRHMYHYYAKHHSYDEWRTYWGTWFNRIVGASKKQSRRDYTLKGLAASILPNSTVYADKEKGVSAQYTSDLQMFISIINESSAEYIPHHEVLLNSLDWIASSVPELQELELDELIPQDLDFYDNWHVGQIHHIPKKGTVVRRPIAVPNRFLQMGLKPYQSYLYDILRGFPRDHTFDQTKTATYVQRRIDKNHYTCSVDLSRATDYLPRNCASFIYKQLIEPNVTEDVALSQALFEAMCDSPWKNGEYLDKWSVGQPLGTLPSFGTLAIEHNLLLESLSLSCGYGHSPYNVLGDDVLLFTKRMRKAYIKLMASLGVPLSMHKSYEHNLVEFAGIIFVKNGSPTYTPDPAPIYWHNLFDYTRNSGILVQYRELPNTVKKRLDQAASKAALRPEQFYRLASELYALSYGRSVHSYLDLTKGVMPYYQEIVFERQKLTPDTVPHHGFHTVQLSSFERSVAGKGTPQRIINTGRGVDKTIPETPEWKKAKLKPASTSTIVNDTISAYKAWVESTPQLGEHSK